jgi:zinc-finger of transposase IS204/IS1001/IS1096/IS1165
VSQSAMAVVRPPASAAVTGRDARELCAWFAPHLAGLQAERVGCAGAGGVIEARSRPADAACPAGGAWSSRVHSRYPRTVQDGPAGGRPALIRLAVRRFLCRNPACPAITFAEQAEGVSVPYRRRSVPLLGLLAQTGLVLAGRAGARLAAVLGIAVHRTTLLGLVTALPDPGRSAAPEVTGVDDFARRKGRVYGTVLAGVPRGDLPGCWLTARPGRWRRGRPLIRARR